MVAITKPSEHFQVVTDTGANILATAQAVFPSNYLIWIKDRANANNHQLIDTVRGASAVLQSNSTGAETTYSAPAGNSVAWCWKAGGAGVSNTAGSITSTVSANTTAGFSIVTYTGTGANATVGHGLGVAPKMVIVKNRTDASNWMAWHISILATDYLIPNSTNAVATNAVIWNSSLPSSDQFAVGTANVTNGSGDSIVAYVFAEIPGYSKFGSYVGNASADGPFVYCGFRPRWILFKQSAGVGSWTLVDAARPGYNVIGGLSYADLTNAESTTALIDFTANGFKLRNTFDPNSASTFVYAAFAEHPFGGSNVSPSPAR